MQQIHQEMTEDGELITAEKLAGPEATKVVASDGVSTPVITGFTIGAVTVTRAFSDSLCRRASSSWSSRMMMRHADVMSVPWSHISRARAGET